MRREAPGVDPALPTPLILMAERDPCGAQGQDMGAWGVWQCGSPACLPCCQLYVHLSCLQVAGTSLTLKFCSPSRGSQQTQGEQLWWPCWDWGREPATAAPQLWPLMGHSLANILPVLKMTHQSRTRLGFALLALLLEISFVISIIANHFCVIIPECKSEQNQALAAQAKGC